MRVSRQCGIATTPNLSTSHWYPADLLSGISMRIRLRDLKNDYKLYFLQIIDYENTLKTAKYSSRSTKTLTKTSFPITIRENIQISVTKKKE
jgi:hypothetical protein